MLASLLDEAGESAGGRRSMGLGDRPQTHQGAEVETGGLPGEAGRGMTNGFFRRRVARPILELLIEGVTPEKIALSLALGAAFGVFPALGWTTTLCAVLAFALKLNLPAIQLVNYLMYPVQ